MRIALVTCGESAKESWLNADKSRYEATVGVNWAVNWFTFDWAVAWDALVWRWSSGKLANIPRIGVVGCGRQPEDLHAKFNARGLRLEFVPRLTDCTTTFPNALEWALCKWPEAHVDIYGLDMDTAQGLAPWPQPLCHSPERWDREFRYMRGIWNEHGGRIYLVGCRVDSSRFIDSGRR
jgi:hypothetical protein